MMLRCVILPSPRHLYRRRHSLYSTSAASKNDDDDERVRNLGIIAHIDAGKTTTTEMMLYLAGATRHVGEVDDGDTVTDYLEQERERGITIQSACVSFSWRGFHINLIDTPGHVDFTFEVERSMSVLDGAVCILDGSRGVEAQTKTVWQQADRMRVPRMIFSNKMDKNNANKLLVLDSVRDKLGASPLPVQTPLYSGRRLKGVVDIIEREVFYCDDSSTVSCPLHSLSDLKLREEVEESREKLVETLVDLDDELGELYLSSSSPSSSHGLCNSDITSAISRVTRNLKGFPLLYGSSLRGVGVENLLNLIPLYLPSPHLLPSTFIKYFHASKDLCALVFKILHHPHKGPITLVRIYSGHLSTNQKCYNIGRKMTEKITAITLPFADEYKTVSTLGAGNVAALMGLQHTSTGDVLLGSYSSLSHLTSRLEEEGESVERVFPSLNIPEPVFFTTIEPESTRYEKQLENALKLVMKEDPSVRVSQDTDTGQTVLAGMGELHLDIVRDRLLTEHKLETYLGPLQISYREGVRAVGEASELVDKVIGEQRQCVEISLSVEPVSDATRESKRDGVDFTLSKETGTSWDLVKHDHMKAVRLGVAQGAQNGPQLGYPLMDVCVTLTSLRVERGTTVPFISMCASQCLAKAVLNAQPCMLEPVMEVNVEVDKPYLSLVLSDLTKRLSHISNVLDDVGVGGGEERGRVVASTPLSQLIGYSSGLRSLTSGTASLSMHFSYYRPLTVVEEAGLRAKLTGISSW